MKKKKKKLQKMGQHDTLYNRKNLSETEWQRKATKISIYYMHCYCVDGIICYPVIINTTEIYTCSANSSEEMPSFGYIGSPMNVLKKEMNYMYCITKRELWYNQSWQNAIGPTDMSDKTAIVKTETL